MGVRGTRKGRRNGRERNRLSLHLRLRLCLRLCLRLRCLCLCALRRRRRRRCGRRGRRVVASGGRRRLQTVALRSGQRGQVTIECTQSADRCASPMPICTAVIRAHALLTHLLACSGRVDLAVVEARISEGRRTSRQGRHTPIGQPVAAVHACRSPLHSCSLSTPQH